MVVGKAKGDRGCGGLWWRGDNMTAVGIGVFDNVVVVEMPTENKMAIGDTENRELSRRPTQRQKRCCVRADEVTEKCGCGGNDCA